MSALCPCCGQAVAVAVTPAAELAAVVGGPRLLGALVERLAHRPGHWVSMDEMIDWLWGADPDGGPLTARNLVAVLVCRSGRYLARHGWRIESGFRVAMGRRLGYRLVML